MVGGRLGGWGGRGVVGGRGSSHWAGGGGLLHEGGEQGDERVQGLSNWRLLCSPAPCRVLHSAPHLRDDAGLGAGQQQAQDGDRQHVVAHGCESGRLRAV